MTIYLHVLKEYFKYVTGLIFLCIFLFILFDFIHKTTGFFPRYKPEPKDIAYYYLYQIPFQFVQVLPIAALIASVMTMVSLSRTNEITAMRAAGMSPIRIGIPLGIGGLILSLISFAIGNNVIPITSAKMRYIEDVKIKKQPDQQLAKGTNWVRSKQKIFNFKQYNPLEGTLYGVKVIDLNKSFKISKITTAEKALFQKEQGNWKLLNTTTKYFKNGRLIKFKRHENFISFLPIKIQNLKRERRIPDEMSIKELNDVISQGESQGKDILEEKVAYHFKFAYPFASFFVSLIGLRFAFRSERTTESAKSIIFAILVGVGYWFLMNAARAFGVRGDINSFVAAWSANFILFIYSIIQIARAQKN